jgi:hypothetical protein
MPVAEAHVTTDRPSRYLVQLCQHASQMGRHRGIAQHLPRRPRSNSGGDGPPEILHADWSGTYGTVKMGWGTWTVRATGNTLTLRAEADTQEQLQRIQRLVAARLEKIGRRDGLTVAWQPAQQYQDPPAEAG